MLTASSIWRRQLALKPSQSLRTLMTSLPPAGWCLWGGIGMLRVGHPLDLKGRDPIHCMHPIEQFNTNAPPSMITVVGMGSLETGGVCMTQAISQFKRD